MVSRIPVGHNPRGVLLSPDGKHLYVANRLDDNISVIDTAADKVVSTIDLGGPKNIDALRRGERLFYTAEFAFQGQFGCANCHLDATIDGLQWDLEPDGFGKDIVDNRSLENLAGTEPFKWNGGNPDMPTECGPRTEKFFFRSQSFTQQQLTDLVTFVYSLPYRPNRYRPANGELTPAQERGKAIFERTKYKSGKPIPEANQCATCHSGPKYTNQKQVDVGTGKPTDRSPVVDVPQLPNVAYSAPYLHDGSAQIAGRDLDGVQPEGHTRGEQRSDQRRIERSDRVLENVMTKRLWLTAIALIFAASALPAQEMPLFRWENFTTANGLPDNHVFCVLVDGTRIWAGTENGLGLYENGAWKVYRPADGLAHQAVLSLAVDKRTGDVWAGTMGGLSRISAGRIDTFTQLNSGLSNDIVYGVGVRGDFVWTATAAGASRLNTRTGQWALFNERNTPMFEIWTYAVSPGEDKVYYAVWGGGVLEYDVQTERWKDYNDPDGETELVLMKDQGLIHEITTSVSYVDKILWVATYFGASRYDGRYWHNFLSKDSGLPSNFLNQIKGIDANRAWFSTDKGLAYYDGANWAVYRPALDTHKPEMLVRDATGSVKKVAVQSAPAHNYILGVDFQGDDLWVATAKGLSHGIRQKSSVEAAKVLSTHKEVHKK